MSLEVKIVRRQRVVRNILVVDYEQYEKLPVVIPTVDKVTMVLIDLMKYICTTRFGSTELLSLEEFDKQFCACTKGIVVKNACTFNKEIADFAKTYSKYNLPIIKFNNPLEGLIS